MKANPCVRLTRKGDYEYVSLTQKGDYDICYRKQKEHPVNPVFCCCLDHEITQKLIKDPGSILNANLKKPKNFWLRTLIEGIGSGGQFIFDTFSPRDDNNSENKLAARTLFQLDGDMLVKIDEHILTRTDGIGIIKAHFSWSNWCFEQLQGALSSNRILRFVLKWLPKIRLLGVVMIVGGGGGVGISFGLNLYALWQVLPIIVGVLIFLVLKLFSFCFKRKIKQFL